MYSENLVLGQEAIFSLNPLITGVNNNIIVCGPSGCGKTESVIEKRLIETRESSLVVTVSKRKVVDKYKDVFLERGYSVHDLNFINPEESDISYDPLDYITSEKDIKHLAEAIVLSDKRKEHSVADPFWDEMAVSLLCALMAYVFDNERKPSFLSVLKLLDRLTIKEMGSSICTSLDGTFDKIVRRQPNSFISNCWRSFSELPIKTAKCVFGTLNTIMDTIFTPELREMLKISKHINIEDISKEKTVLFISTSSVNHALHSYVNIFYSQIFKRLFEYAEKQPFGELEIPVHMLIDDFALGCRILSFPEYISIIREKKLAVMLVIQSESQLERMYGYDDAVTILNNCDTYLYMGGNDLKTCRNICERLNYPLDEVLSMPVGREYVFRRGIKPIITERYDIHNDDDYKEITKKYVDKVNKRFNQPFRSLE